MYLKHFERTSLLLVGLLTLLTSCESQDSEDGVVSAPLAPDPVAMIGSGLIDGPIADLSDEAVERICEQFTREVYPKASVITCFLRQSPTLEDMCLEMANECIETSRILASGDLYEACDEDDFLTLPCMFEGCVETFQMLKSISCQGSWTELTQCISNSVSEPSPEDLCNDGARDDTPCSLLEDNTFCGFDDERALRESSSTASREDDAGDDDEGDADKIEVSAGAEG